MDDNLIVKPLRNLAHYYVHLLSRLGLFKFTLSLASLIVVVALAIQMIFTFMLTGTVSQVDVIRSVFFGLIITPWAVFFMSVVVDQLEESRQRLTRMIRKLEKMRARDLQLNQKLKENIELLNTEIGERTKAEEALQQTMQELRQEVRHRQKAQNELEERSSLLRSFIDTSPDLVFYRSENSVFSGCNRAVAKLTGLSESEMIGLTPVEIYPEDVAKLEIETDQEVFRTDHGMTYAQWLTYPDGRKAYFELHKVPFYDSDGKRLGLLGFGRDTTERKHYQEELEQASREKTEFISTLSHELRTPLNGVVGLSQILLDSPLNADQRQKLQTIYISAVTLGNIFNDIIDLDKLDRRRFTVTKAPMELPTFLSDIEHLSVLQLQSRNLEFSMHCSEQIPQWVDTDATRLRQILWNLTSNAAKFTEQGQVQIRFSVEQWQQEHCVLVFEVEDTGIGIAQAELDKIFAMYYQVENSKQATGTGIGLAVSQQFVQALGGTLSVRSEVGQGTCFTLRLPVTICQGDEPIEDEDELPPLHLLLVEDVELNIQVATTLLENQGHEIKVARTGQEALQLVAENDDFDVLLLDIQLPDMTGLELADQLQFQFKDQLPPMVALTANVVNSKADYQKHGIVDVIRKPLSLTAVNRVFNQLFNVVPVTENESEAELPLISEDGILNETFLNEFCGVIGTKGFRQNINLFEQTIDEYIGILASNLMAQDDDGIVSEAHKIKGAAGSVGLARMQQLANQMQSPELPAWRENLNRWFNLLKDARDTDITALQQWLDHYDQQ
ncbi:aerobic respiration two-component sensor histidine kinase ArcB [Celerinatantimonas sp. YJH-8]|uniref:aerobic respiration two-component sensor histidine kinase ArcB n=1 Tax=Celerinatantimonas sp. YJH-8 TaxID=3228714 RepID=UPI0038C062A6